MLNQVLAYGRHFEFHIGTKNVKFVEDHPMNIHVQFMFFCSFDRKFEHGPYRNDIVLTLDPMDRQKNMFVETFQ